MCKWWFRSYLPIPTASANTVLFVYIVFRFITAYYDCFLQTRLLLTARLVPTILRYQCPLGIYSTCFRLRLVSRCCLSAGRLLQSVALHSHFWIQYADNISVRRGAEFESASPPRVGDINTPKLEVFCHQIEATKYVYYAAVQMYDSLWKIKSLLLNLILKEKLIKSKYFVIRECLDTFLIL